MNTIKKLIEGLSNLGYQHAVFCTGARNALIVKAIADSERFQLWSQPDERSASFFAMGLSRNQSKKAFVVTTSGTAVSECFSAIIEAHYQNSPLLIITADRPKRYHQSGAPQTINQIKIFGDYAHYFELSDPESNWDLKEWQAKLDSLKGPIHLNFFLEDPKEFFKNWDGNSFKKSLSPVVTSNSNLAPYETLPTLDGPMISIANPVVILGPLYEEKEIELAQDWLNGLPEAVPVMNEATSNTFSKSSFLIGDGFIKKQIEKKQIQSLIKIGGTPTHSIWREIEDNYADLPIYNFTNSRYPGLARTQLVSRFYLADLSRVLVKSDFTTKLFFHENQRLIGMRDRLLDDFSLSEVAWFSRLKKVSQNARVYLGNSLPVRYWDFAAETKPLEVWANRGANGIDGQISSFFGWALNHREKDSSSHFMGIFGDLTAFYDMQAFWFYKTFRDRFDSLKISLFIMNNGGGRIFNKVLYDPLFINQHEINFRNLSKMFLIPYEPLKEDSDFKLNSKGLKIFEVFPSLSEQEEFDKAWRAK
jgi:2-succinyl-5-enolpyruvyl-6-hydroxy-3-cyclohexene-1-carboxylate synthase